MRKGSHHSESAKKKLSAALSGRNAHIWCKGLTKETDNRVARIGVLNSERMTGRLPPNFEAFSAESVRTKTGSMLREWYGNLSEEGKSELRRKRMRRRLPSKPEQMFIELCIEVGLPYKYVGNGGLFIGGKNPDFVSTEDERNLVEIWGDFYHRQDDPQKRIKYFADRGYKCLIVKASDLLNRKEWVISEVQHS